MKTRIQKEFAATITRTPSCAVSVVAGSVSGTGIKGRDQATGMDGDGTGIVQAMAVIVNADTFPPMKIGEPITVGEETRIVTNHSVDPIGALRKIGVSSPLNCKMALTGTRRENAIARNAAQTVDCLVFGPQKAEELDGSDSETTDLFWNVLMVNPSWLDHLPPQVGDTISITGYPQMKVRHVMNDGKVINIATRSTRI